VSSLDDGNHPNGLCGEKPPNSSLYIDEGAGSLTP
jgi:hypothetical protein